MVLHDRLRQKIQTGPQGSAPLISSKKKLQPKPSSYNFGEVSKIRTIKENCQKRAADDSAFYRPDSEETRSDLAPRIEALVREVAKEIGHHLAHNEVRLLGSELLDEIYGLGPLEFLLADPTITDILINGHKSIYVERNGKIEPTDVSFISEDHLRNKVERMLYTAGRRVDEASPVVDARLPDGSRINIIIPPLAVDGITVSIRKFPDHPLRIKDLIVMGCLVEPMYQFLNIAIKSKLNILICGGTGSGKTTTLNMLSGLIPDDERIVTIEDSAELRLQQRHVVRLESRPANAEGVGEFTQRDLLKNALRMRPDRIIIGEIRGGEVLDMLQAMNTGHDGSLATVHANTPRDSISRLELMINLSGVNLAGGSIRRQIVSALDLIIHIDRGDDGVRRVISITELTGIEEDNIVMQEIFAYEGYETPRNGRIGAYFATGVRPATKSLATNKSPEMAALFNCRVEV
ncbi:MAG: CpaF family protein [Desulfobulbaceae bacterium]|jgi:pilus assembly protein CpaF|nr:CpaF family protein [Desulfobulbaceae bacterium]